MDKAIVYGFLSGFALLIGSVIGLYIKVPKRVLALIMAFGCGVLISSMSVDLMTEAFEMSKQTFIVGLAFLLGAIVFVGGDSLIDRIGGEKRKTSHWMVSQDLEGNSGNAILLGTLLDGIPESLVMGAALAKGGGAGLVFVAAVFLSNFPEGIAGTIAMKNAGMNTINILGIWISMLAATILFTVIGYQFLGNASSHLKAFALSFASGAILAMLSDSMLPEAFKEGEKLTGILVALGFLIAFLLTNIA